MPLLFVNQAQQFLQLGIVCRGDILHHQGKKLQIFSILFQIMQPRNMIHIRKINLYFAADCKNVVVLVIIVPIGCIGNVVQLQHTAAILIGTYRLHGIFNQFTDSVNRQPERINRTFQPFEQVNAHQTADSLFTACLRQSLSMLAGVDVFGNPRGQNKAGWCVNVQRQ